MMVLASLGPTDDPPHAEVHNERMNTNRRFIILLIVTKRPDKKGFGERTSFHRFAKAAARGF
jgi:hypothetical protein